MTIKEAKEVRAIIVSDLHLRDTQPVCRLDDFIETQIIQLRWLSELKDEICAKSHRNSTEVPVLCGGDIFDKWKASPFLMGIAIDYLPFMITTIGNHDLPAHNFNLFHKSGAGVLLKVGQIDMSINSLIDVSDFRVLTVPFGIEGEIKERHREKANVILVHDLVETEAEAKAWARKFPKAELIVIGDNHTSAVYPFKDLPLVLVPGSFNVQTADQIGNPHSVWLWLKDGLPIPVEVPDDKTDMTREHIADKEEMDERMEEFVSSFVHRLQDGKELGLDFKSNLTSFIKDNDIDQETSKIIWEAVNGNN